MKLIDATPTLHQEVRKDEWMFQYGTGEVGQPCGAAYVNRQNPRYVRFHVTEKAGRAVFEPVSERPLTAEELRHFRALIRKLQTPIIDREHGRFV